MSCIFTSFSSQEAANFGNFCTGIAAFFTLAIIVFTAFKEIPKWRHQQVKQREAEVAGKVAVATFRLFQALSYLTSVLIESPEDPSEKSGPQKKSYQSRRTFEKRLEVTAQDLNNFFASWNESKVYLPDTVNAKLEELWKLWVSTKTDIQMHHMQLDLDQITDPSFYDRSFGTKGSEARKTLELELTTLLKPLARMED